VPLDRQLILHHAFIALNETGLEGLTLRRLAARLNVQAPAIYWHFKNKQDLLDEMATQVFRESYQESAALETLHPWQAWANATSEALRKTLLRYREGAKMFSGTYLTDAELYAPMEANLRRLTREGFTLRQAVVGLTALYSYTIGFVILTNRAPAERIEKLHPRNTWACGAVWERASMAWKRSSVRSRPGPPMRRADGLEFLE
jgi:TetR/AcrR family tetracycline transcriptional repressor